MEKKLPLVEKKLSLAHQNGLSLVQFSSPATYMPAVMLTAGEFCSLSGFFFTADAFGMCARDKHVIPGEFVIGAPGIKFRKI
jgi:hypothetical protein